MIFLHEGKILLKENTQDLLEHSVYVSGKTEAVDRLIQGKQIYCPEVLGRSKSALVRLREGERLSGGEGVTLQGVNLQKIFVALCGGEERV